MAKLSRWQEAIIHLHSAYDQDEYFTYEEARIFLAGTSFGDLKKQSWNALIKNKVIAVDENGIAHFSDEDMDMENKIIRSPWTDTHRKHFICKSDPRKAGYGDFFTSEELTEINGMYFDWKETCKKYQYFGCRRQNLPEPISEGLSSALFGWARTNNLPLENIPCSADLVDIEDGAAIQVKGISTYYDGDEGPTSFGPDSKFDRLIILLVKLNEDKAYFYEIPDPQQYTTWKVNSTQTVADQQAQKKRPRLDMIPIIKSLNLEPFQIYDFNTGRT